jgi:hypothetical protein
MRVYQKGKIPASAGGQSSAPSIVRFLFCPWSPAAKIEPFRVRRCALSGIFLLLRQARVLFVLPPALVAVCAQAQVQVPASAVQICDWVPATGRISLRFGWRVANGLLPWTRNGGAAWKDITPPGPATSVQVVYALDRKRIWAVVADQPKDLSPQHSWHLVRTTNTGETWSTLPFNGSLVPSLMDAQACPVELFFVDSDRGWFLWRSPLRLTSSGVLFRTKDGGRTWAELPEPPSGDGFEFYTKRDGWMIAGDNYRNQLWGTHDAGQSWRQYTVPWPKSCKLNCDPYYHLPGLRYWTTAVLAVTFIDYSGPEGRFILARYTTRNNGKSWKVQHIFE